MRQNVKLWLYIQLKHTLKIAKKCLDNGVHPTLPILTFDSVNSFFLVVKELRKLINHLLLPFS
ncbi:hypothetical protein CULT_2330002 [[Clostridium] ultunense Esp]|nr:hypothetical protein CULT_2330002 [[Clostridium] ultunense Esp]